MGFRANLNEKEDFYFTNYFEDAVLWHSKKDGYFVKFKGKTEFSLIHSSKVVIDGLCDRVEITKKECDQY